MEKVKYGIKKNKKLIAVYLIIFIIIGMYASLIYEDSISEMSDVPKSVMTVKNEAFMGVSTPQIPLPEGTKVEQKISMVTDEWTGFSLWLEKNQGTMEGYLDILLKDSSGNCVKQWKLEAEELLADGFHAFCTNPIYVKAGDVYYIEIVSHSSGSMPFVMCGSTETSDLIHCVKIDGAEADYSLAYQILNGGNHALLYFYFLILAGIVVCLVVTAILLMTGKKKEWIFAVMAFIIGGIYMLVLPPYATPDEAAHFTTTYAESSMILQKPVIDDEGKVIMDSEAASFFSREESVTKNSYSKYLRGLMGRDEDLTLEGMSTRTPLGMKNLGYVPQVIGVTLGRLIGLNSIQLLFAGRLCALLWYCFVMFWAIRLMPLFGKNILFAVGLLPMTMQMAVSYNYDSVLLGASLFLISYILYLAYSDKKKKVEIRDYILLLAAIAVILPLKVVYFPLLGLGLLIPKEKFGSMRNKIIAAGALCVAGAVIFLGTRGDLVASNVATVAVTETQSKYFTLGQLLDDPVKAGDMFLRTLASYSTFYLESMIGNPLGWLDIPIPNIIIAGFVVLLFMSMMQSSSEKHQWKILERGWMALLIIGAGVLVLLALLLGWTSANAFVIEGVQGRYFIPLLPVLLLVLQNHVIELKKNIDKILITGINILQVMTIMNIVVTVSNR